MLRIQLSLPQDMKGAQIEPGREFLTELSGAIEAAEQRLSGEAQNAQTQTVTVEVNEEQAIQEIEDMVQSASEMGLDTLFVNLENAYGTLWNSSCPMVSFDVLGSLSDAVSEAGMQLYGIYDLSFVAGDGSHAVYAFCQCRNSRSEWQSRLQSLHPNQSWMVFC